MSRTYKGSKGPGYEYWQSRYAPRGERPGRFTKRLTHKRERHIAKKDSEGILDDCGQNFDDQYWEYYY